jgi:hypothetical protein
VDRIEVPEHLFAQPGELALQRIKSTVDRREASVDCRELLTPELNELRVLRRGHGVCLSQLLMLFKYVDVSVDRGVERNWHTHDSGACSLTGVAIRQLLGGLQPAICGLFAFGVRAIEQGFRVYFMPAHELSTSTDAAKPSTGSSAVSGSTWRPTPLIIDGFGVSPYDRMVAIAFFTFVSAHYERGSILMSNKGSDEWATASAIP